MAVRIKDEQRQARTRGRALAWHVKGLVLPVVMTNPGYSMLGRGRGEAAEMASIKKRFLVR